MRPSCSVSQLCIAATSGRLCCWRAWPAFVGGLAADIGLDRVKGSDPPQRLLSER